MYRIDYNRLKCVNEIRLEDERVFTIIDTIVFKKRNKKDKQMILYKARLTDDMLYYFIDIPEIDFMLYLRVGMAYLLVANIEDKLRREAENLLSIVDEFELNFDYLIKEYEVRDLGKI